MSAGGAGLKMVRDLALALTLTLILIGEGLEVVRDGGTDQHVSLHHLANDPFGVL